MCTHFILTQLSTAPHRSFSAPMRQLRILSGTRRDLEVSNMHGMWHYRKLPMNIFLVPNSGPQNSQSYRVAAKGSLNQYEHSHSLCAEYKKHIITKDVCSSYLLLCTNNNSHPKTQRLKTKCILSHNSVGWPGVLPRHLVLAGAPGWPQSSGDLIGLECPKWLTYMAASCWLLAGSSAEDVNQSTYTWNLHVDWAS